MITSIEKIKDFGIYRNYVKKPEVENFTKYNLIYGWNGSGKSTLSKLFALLRNDSKNNEFKNCKYDIILDSGISVNEDTRSIDLNISVFNSSFINDNIDWNDTVKSILLISEGKIDEQKKLRKYTQDWEEKIGDKRKNESTIKECEKEIRSFLSSTAKYIKEHFQVIDTKDKYYLNYNRTRLEKFIEYYSQEIQKGESILSQERIITVTKSIKPETRTKINLVYQKLDKNKLLDAKVRMTALLKTKILTKTIQKLKENKDISNWVEEGLKIHSRSISEKCEFCGETISQSRFDELESHFNNDYKEFKKKLIDAGSWIVQQKLTVSKESSTVFSLFEEYQNPFKDSMDIIEKLTININKMYDNWFENLEKRIENPFETINLQELVDVDEGIINQYNEQIEAINKLISLHNNKCENYQTETQKQKFLLEIHYASKALSEFEYFKKLNDIEILKGKVANKQKELKIINDKINAIEKELTNEILGAEKFNQQLQMFLGHSEISLIFDKDKKGYKIIRTKTNKIARNLSEGEKTAIAFVYFITKLRENGKDVKDEIVVIDDPISSFDSNNLFSAYSFLKNHWKKQNNYLF